MKLSKYDKNHDGICDASACKNVLTDHRRPRGREGLHPGPRAERSKSIGITIKDRVLKDAYTPIQTTAQQHPVLDAPGLGQGLRRRPDVLRPALRRPQHHPDRATPTTPWSASRPRIAKKVGVKGNVTDVPSINADLDKCGVLVGNAALSCYAALDKKLTTQIVPWVPYLWSYAPERHEQERHAVRVRPVRRDDRLRPRGGEVLI